MGGVEGGGRRRMVVVVHVSVGYGSSAIIGHNIVVVTKGWRVELPLQPGSILAIKYHDMLLLSWEI